MPSPLIWKLHPYSDIVSQLYKPAFYSGHLSHNIVVATTRQNGTCDMLTSAKLSVGYLVVGIIRELNKKLSLHCSSIYTITS